jgi:hypothetical protein
MELLFETVTGDGYGGYMEADNAIMLAVACTLSMTCFHPILIK